MEAPVTTHSPARGWGVYGVNTVVAGVGLNSTGLSANPPGSDQTIAVVYTRSPDVP